MTGYDSAHSPRRRRAMLIGFANLKTALIVLVGVLVLFFFPAPRGSFVSTHGPMTSLRSALESSALWPTLVLASLLVRKFFANLTRLGPSSTLFAAPIAEGFHLKTTVLRI